MVTAKRTTEAISNIRSTCVIPCRLSSILAGSRRSTLGFAGYLEEATFDNDFISIGSFSISMPPRQCVSESSIVGTDWPASSRCDAQLPKECGEARQSLYVGQR